MKRQRMEITEDHPALHNVCPVCNRVLNLGDAYIEVPMGPGGDNMKRKLAREGRFYEPQYIVVHQVCMTGEG